MKIVKSNYKIMRGLDRNVLPFLEECGRTCYKSEEYITEGSSEKFIKGIVKSGHESVIEHAFITVRFTAPRSLTHQLVRHRLASYSQESQRYVNYSKGKFNSEISFIDPLFQINGNKVSYFDYLEIKNRHVSTLTQEEFDIKNIYEIFEDSCKRNENDYFNLIHSGLKPEDAREVLPNCGKTEIVMTANLRVWRHVFKERAFNPKAQYQIRKLLLSLYEEFNKVLPEIFSDLKTDK